MSCILPSELAFAERLGAFMQAEAYTTSPSSQILCNSMACAVHVYWARSCRAQSADVPALYSTGNGRLVECLQKTETVVDQVHFFLQKG